MTKPTPTPRRPRTGVPSRPRSERALGSKALAAPLAVDVNIDPTFSGSVTKGPAGKLGVVVAMLARPEGATVAQISAVTDWQAHSVRGAFAGALKKKHGLTIVSRPAEGGRVYTLDEIGA